MAHALVVLTARHAERLGLALLWLAAGLAAIAPPEASRRPDSPPALQRVVEAVAEGAAVAIATAPDGSVWWVTRDRAVRFDAGEPSRRRAAVAFGALPPGLRGASGPISAAHVDREGALWLGTRHGSVWSWREGTWREQLGGFSALRGPIQAIATDGDRVYVGARGLWRGPREGRLEAVPTFAGVEIVDARSHAGLGVAVASRDRVWRGDASGWREVWRASGGDAATTVALAAEDSLWVGTRRGLVRIDRTGRASRALDGLHVSSLATDAEGAVYAGTSGSGLFLRYAGGWRRVGAAGGRSLDHVTRLSPTAGGTLWLALASGDLLRAGPASASLPRVSAR